MKLNKMRVNEPHPQQLQDIAIMTDENRHGEALEYIAKISGQKKAQKIFSLINQLHDIEGSMPSDLREYRRRIAKEMYLQIEKDKGTEYFNAIHSAL